MSLLYTSKETITKVKQICRLSLELLSCYNIAYRERDCKKENVTWSG